MKCCQIRHVDYTSSMCSCEGQFKAIAFAQPGLLWKLKRKRHQAIHFITKFQLLISSLQIIVLARVLLLYVLMFVLSIIRDFLFYDDGCLLKLFRETHGPWAKCTPDCWSCWMAHLKGQDDQFHLTSAVDRNQIYIHLLISPQQISVLPQWRRPKMPHKQKYCSLMESSWT